MILWMGGELQSDVADEYREVRNIVEPAINSRISSKDYGPPVVKWAFIAMILREDLLSSYKEVKRFKRKEKICEFRLVIDHSRFKTADPNLRTRMVCDALLRSLSLLEELGIPDVETAPLREDVLSVLRERKWLD